MRSQVGKVAVVRIGKKQAEPEKKNAHGTDLTGCVIMGFTMSKRNKFKCKCGEQCRVYRNPNLFNDFEAVCPACGKKYSMFKLRGR